MYVHAVRQIAILIPTFYLIYVYTYSSLDCVYIPNNNNN